MDQHVAAMLGQAAEDVRYLTRSLALAEDHFRHPLAEGAMVVHLGEAQVFKWEVAQPLDRFVGRQLFLSNLLEQLAKRG